MAENPAILHHRLTPTARAAPFCRQRHLVTLNFKPFNHAGFSFRCGASVENIPWTMRNWQHLDGRYLAGDSYVPEIHASFYTSDHNSADQYQLEVRYLKRDLFEVLLRMEINFFGYTEADADPQLVVVGRATARYSGLLMVPGNFKRPAVRSVEELTKLAESFVDLSYYKPPVKEQSCYRFAPKF